MNRSRDLKLIVLALVLAPVLDRSAGPALAWGRMGHRVSGRLAEARLTPAAKAAVRDLLEPGESLADVSTWADEVRRDYPESGPWHYVNVPITEPVYAAKFCPESGCVVSKIAEFRAVLADTNASRAERQKAFKFLVHFVQDIHQPLHVGDRRDRGGNDLQLQFFEEGSNLHKIWDSGLLEQGHKDEADLFTFLEASISPDLAAKWALGTVEDWANESLQRAKRAYLVPGTETELQKGDKLGPDYQDLHLPVARERVKQSAVRLAAILNELFR